MDAYALAGVREAVPLHGIESHIANYQAAGFRKGESGSVVGLNCHFNAGNKPIARNGMASMTEFAAWVRGNERHRPITFVYFDGRPITFVYFDVRPITFVYFDVRPITFVRSFAARPIRRLHRGIRAVLSLVRLKRWSREGLKQRMRWMS